MRITRLQLLLIVIALIGAGYAGFVWNQKQGRPSKIAQAPMPKPVSRTPTPAPISSAPATPLPKVSTPSPKPIAAVNNGRDSAHFIAIVGEAYLKIMNQAGDVPAISTPLRAAKAAQAAGDFAKAKALADQALTAIKAFKKKNASATYHVTKGDTLWLIAEKHSPVRQGAGWVGIWKANKRLIKDFDRLEVGWNLAIPQKLQSYVTPYWKPARLASAKKRTSTARQPLPVTEVAARRPNSLIQQLYLEKMVPSAARTVAWELPASSVLPPIQYH